MIRDSISPEQTRQPAVITYVCKGFHLLPFFRGLCSIPVGTTIRLAVSTARSWQATKESAKVVFESNGVPRERSEPRDRRFFPEPLNPFFCLLFRRASGAPVTGLDGFITFQITKKFSGNG